MILHGQEAERQAWREDEADAEPVVLLHGLFGRAQNLAALARLLAPHRRVLSLDLRNHGQSGHEAGMDYPTQAADVLETLASRRALPCALLGHSMGGKVAMAAALLAPGSVRRLIVADIAPVSYAHDNAAVAAAMGAVPLDRPMTRAQADFCLQDAVPRQEVRQFLLQNFMPGPAPAWRIGLHHIAADMPAIESWPDLAVPAFGRAALFIRGGLSDYVLPAHLPAIAALFPRARIETVEGAGHWLHAERPAQFGACVAGFLAREAPVT